MTEEIIKQITAPDELLSDELLNGIFDVSDEVTKARLIVAVQNRARELKCIRQANTIIKAYKAEEKKIAAQYNRFDLDIGLKYGEDGKPLNTIGNFESIIKNDEHFKVFVLICSQICPK